MFYFLILLFCYLIGAIPTSFILVKLFLGSDIRTMGSGNSGATNTGRFLGKPGFFVVLLVDALKAYLALALAALLCAGSPLIMLCATGAVYLGNAYSPFIGFSGGKGVATSVGILVYLFPLWIFFLCLTVFAALAYRFGRVDVASLGASAFAPLFLLCTGQTAYVVLIAGVIAAWIWVRHARNVAQLIHLYWLRGS